MICTSCGAHLEPGDRFCAECGTPMAAAKPVCGTCGGPLAADDRFCGTCGSPVQAAPPSPHAAPRPPAAAPAPAAAPMPPAAAATSKSSTRLPMVTWFLVLFTLYNTAGVVMAWAEGVGFYFGDPIGTPLAVSFVAAIVLTLLLWVACIGLLSRARWAYRLARFSVGSTIVLRVAGLAWLIYNIRTMLSPDPILEIVGNVVGPLNLVFGAIEVALFIALGRARAVFASRAT